ncbi:MAG: hypothetical protein SFV54_01055 [Bryobacteraceae bacterium]|nr:hypothetical protein [Bryobacteraceae bacterium]
MAWFFTLENTITLIVLLATLWLAYYRYAGRLDSNLPLFYYVAVVVYMNSFEGILDPPMVYGAVVAALLLRFEFMGGFFLWIVRAIEVLYFLYFCWRAFGVFMMWW